MSTESKIIVRTVTGTVVSNKMKDTIVVQVERKVKHKLYKKYIRLYSKMHAHDESNQCRLGDTVEIQQCRPISKLKRWKLIQVLSTTDENS